MPQHRPPPHPLGGDDSSEEVEGRSVNGTVDSGDDSMERQLNIGLLISEMLLYFLCFAFSLSLSTLYWAYTDSLFKNREDTLRAKTRYMILRCAYRRHQKIQFQAPTVYHHSAQKKRKRNE
jgi:hypothetical protein